MTLAARLLVPVAEPGCAVHAACGGCPLLEKTYADQRDQKLSELRALFQRAGLQLPGRIEWVSLPSWFGYRNRLRLLVTPGGQPRHFNPHKAEACPVVEASVLLAIEELRTLARARPEALAGISHLEVRAPDSEGRRGLRCVRRVDAPPDVPRWLELGADWLVTVTPCDVDAIPCQRWKVPGAPYVDVPLDAFMQVNTAVNGALVAHVVSGLLERGVSSFADLFMGAGNFALPLLAAGLPGLGVERHVGAAAAARRAAHAQGLDGEALLAGDALTYAKGWLDGGRSVDAVLCDPPRVGLGPRAVLAGRLARHWLVLCSCQPETLSEDVKHLLPEGFRIERMAAFDMFPQTRHLEVVVWLERTP